MHTKNRNILIGNLKVEKVWMKLKASSSCAKSNEKRRKKNSMNVKHDERIFNDTATDIASRSTHVDDKNKSNVR